MPLVTTTEMFQKAYAGGYAIGAFNVNNMEIIQGITEAAQEVNSPLILQVSAGARKYAKPVYLRKLVEAAIEDTGLPMALHLDHGEDFEICKSCIDGGFTSVMIDGSKHSFEDNIALTRQVVEYCRPLGVPVEAELGHVGEAAQYDLSNYHYTDPGLTVAQLAKYTYTSREHLSRVFKEYTLESVHGYLTNLRMQHCRNAIAAGASVLDACNASGFTNYSSFLKSFRALYGVTPTEYRAQLRQSLAPN